MTDPRRVVVVGASLAGLRAAEAARKAGFDGSLTLVGAEPHLPYDRPPLSKAFLDADGEAEATFFRSEETLLQELGVELRLGAAATGLDTDEKFVEVGSEKVPYDILVIATGAAARTLPGSQHLAGVHQLRTLDDAIAVRAALDAGARTVVIGAGFIGSEVASGARKRGVEVTVVEALETPLVRAAGTEMGPAIAALHEHNGTTLRCGIGVERIVGEKSVRGVALSDGTEIECDLVVVGIGAIPNTAWLADSGLDLENGVVCDEYLFAGADGVYAAGDVARWQNPTFGIPQRLEHWTSAAEQGAAAMRNALDPANAKPYSTVPYFWSDWYDSRIQFVGVPDADEVVAVDGEPGVDHRWIALYRKGDRLVGALTVNAQTEIMKYRVQIMRGGDWATALEFAEKRRLAQQAKTVAR